MKDELNREEREVLEKFDRGELRSVGGVESEMTAARHDAEAMTECPRCAHPRVPNAETQRAMAEAEEMTKRGTARFASVEELLADLNEGGEE